jgi:cytochrome c-type biogenesis protein CcmF
VQPNLTGVQRSAAAADRGFRTCIRGGEGTPQACGALAALMRGAAGDPALRETALEQIGVLQAATINRVADGYVDSSTPVTFRVIVNPMVSWMWIGALIALAGALIAIWPTPGAGRRRVASAAAARLGRELSRA